MSAAATVGQQEDILVQPIVFPPQILARVSPELSLQRHLSLGFRPSLRSFQEFRAVSVESGNLSRYGDASTGGIPAADDNVLGSAVLRSGDVFVVTRITGGIVENSTFTTSELRQGQMEELDGLEGDAELLELTADHSDITKYTSVYPVVEVERGRMGACTDEEMTISQRLYDGILYSKLLPKESLKVVPGVRIHKDNGETKIIYPDSTQNEASAISDVARSFIPNRHWSFVLYANVEVFGRTGPIFDLCWNSLVYALKSVKLPRVFIDERAIDLKMTVRTRGRTSVVRETYDILCDPERWDPLRLNEMAISFSSNYGVIDLDPEADINDEAGGENTNEAENPNTPAATTVLLADIDGEAEEVSIKSTLTIVGNSQGKLRHMNIVGGGATITPDVIKKSLLLARKRSKDLERR